MRWLYHIQATPGSPLPALYAPDSLASEGFIHASFQGDVRESARLYFRAEQALTVLRIDPRRLDARVEIAATPRGPMPHVHGPIPRDAVVEELTLDAIDAIDAAPDRVVGTRIAFVAFDGMTLLDLVGIHDPLSRIASMDFDRTSTCTIVSATGPRVWAAGGAALTVDAVRPALDAFDVLVIPGGHGTRALEQDAAVIDWLRGYPPNRIAASVCTGALLLGAAGRLRGKRATTHHTAMARLVDFEAIATNGRVVDEGQLVTGGGVTCALDVGIHLVRRLAGDETARAIARQMELAP
jgi:cyclohexyl-isocyanide hydratase